MTVMVRAAVLTNYIDVAQHHGLSAQAELSRVGLTKNLLLDPDQTIPVRSAVQLLENSAAASGCQTSQPGVQRAASRNSEPGRLAVHSVGAPRRRRAISTALPVLPARNDPLCKSAIGSMV